MISRCDLLAQYHDFQSEVELAVKEVLASGSYILGSRVARFEEEYQRYQNCKHALGVANGTDALILGLRAYDIGPGDEVITTPFTAIPTVSAIISLGAIPVFVDIDRETFLFDLNEVV